METIIGGREFAWGSRTYVMGVLNVTPDSFSGDGLAGDLEAAVALGMQMVADGADIIDVGGESTRPGHTPVGADEEMARVLPVVAALASKVRVPISIDTSKLEVAEEAAAAGASMINDVWGLERSPGLARLAGRAGLGLVVMHNQQGTQYQDLISDVRASLQRSVIAALAAGVAPQRVIVDPGIGFGKTAEQNLVLLRRLQDFKAIGQPLLVGTSRKGFIGRLLDLPVEERVEGTAATVAAAVLRGADVVRVHDVKVMARVARVADAIK